MEIENNSAYTIICVKRKLNEEDNNNDDRYNSFKKLRHVGSFAEKRDDKTSKQLLRQVGIAEPNTKRLKVSDLTEEQFKSYVEKYEDKLEATGDEKLQSDANDSISKDKDDEKNSVNPNSSDYNDHEKTLQPNSSGNLLIACYVNIVNILLLYCRKPNNVQRDGDGREFIKQIDRLCLRLLHSHGQYVCGR